MNMEREEPQYPAEILADLEKPAAPASWLLHAADPAQWAEGGTLRKNLADSLKGFPTGLQLWKKAETEADRRSSFADNGFVPVPLKLPMGITLIASSTGGGKTLMLTELAARALLADRPVVFFTGEEAAGKIVGMIAVKYRNLKDGENTSYKEFATACQTKTPDFAAFKNLYIVNSVEAPTGLQIEKVSEQIRDAWKDLQEPLILIDYVQLLQPPSGERVSQAYEKMKAVMGPLKALGAQGIPTVLAAQLHREGINNGGEPEDAFWAIRAENMREAADLEQAASLILLAWLTPNKESLWLRILKDRNGENWGGVAAYDVTPKSRALNASSCVYLEKTTESRAVKAPPTKPGLDPANDIKRGGR